MTTSPSYQAQRVLGASDQLSLLDLLLRKLPPDEQAVHCQVLREAIQGGPASSGVVVGRLVRERETVGVVLAQLLPGRVALLWPPRFTVEVEHDVAAIQTLLDFLWEELARRRVAMVQALVSPTAMSDSELFQQAGLTRVAELSYMCLTFVEPPVMELVPEDHRFESATPSTELLRLTLIDTYVDSLDCPLVDSWREIDDVLEGYYATGSSGSKWWRVLMIGNEPAACILLADFAHLRQWELVYLGVRPAFRGQGIARKCLAWSVQQAWEEGADRIVLAVDAANQPAIGIYESYGFAEFERRVAWGKQLS